MRKTGILAVLIMLIIPPVAKAQDWLTGLDHEVSEDGRSLYAIRIEAGLIGIIYAGAAHQDALTTSERVNEVLKAMLENSDYVYGALAYEDKGYVIARTFDDPAQLNAYIADLKEKAVHVDKEIVARNACAAREQEPGVKCFGYSEPKEPTQAEIQRAIAQLRVLWD